MKDKKITLLVVTIIVSLLVALGVAVYQGINTLSGNKNAKNTTTKTTSVDKALKNKAKEKNSGITDKDISKMTEEQKKTFVMGQEYEKEKDAYKLGDSKNEEYPKNLSNTLYNELISLAQSAKYDQITSKVEGLTKKYKFTTDYNWKIGNVYLDAYVMLGAKDVADKSQVGYMLQSIKDPKMLLISTLVCPERSRRNVIANTESLSPIFKGNVLITNTEEYDVKNYKNDAVAKVIIENEPSLEKVYKYTFKIEKYQLVAYIIQYTNGKLKFYTINNPDSGEKSPYRTISYWISIDDKFGGLN